MALSACRAWQPAIQALSCGALPQACTRRPWLTLRLRWRRQAQGRGSLGHGQEATLALGICSRNRGQAVSPDCWRQWRRKAWQSGVQHVSPGCSTGVHRGASGCIQGDTGCTAALSQAAPLTQALLGSYFLSLQALVVLYTGTPLLQVEGKICLRASPE